MTTFVLSHNLQIQSPTVPAFELQQLAEGLCRNTRLEISTEVLSHPHWLLSVTSEASPTELAQDLADAWLKLRGEMKHEDNHNILALGGRKDNPASPGSPLKEGFWGVDVVETVDVDNFLKSIDWAGLKATRPADAVFEISNS